MKNLEKILLTGASGFIGQNIIKSNKNYTVKVKRIDNNLVTIVNGNIAENNDNASIDRLVAQMFGYTFKKIKVNEKGRQRQYNFEVVGKETVSSIFGSTE